MTSHSKTAKRWGRKLPQRVTYSQRVASWGLECERLERVIERLKLNPAPMGEDWRTGQVAYFEQRLNELVASRPQRKLARKMPT